ncbi:MAG: hypothetical protein KatS3mg054_1040 [Chloroflexus sp.]|nr:MAG: hypothetical protein KatS3mg054_1040 [Chloroflexus sp.]
MPVRVRQQSVQCLAISAPPARDPRSRPGTLFNKPRLDPSPAFQSASLTSSHQHYVAGMAHICTEQRTGRAEADVPPSQKSRMCSAAYSLRQ